MHYKVKRRYGQSGWQLEAYYGPKPSDKKYVPKESWPAGLTADMPLEAAREYVKSLNASARIPAEEASRLRAKDRQMARGKLQHALLPTQLVGQFERIFFGTLPLGSPKRVKREGIWYAAQRLIVDTGLSPSDWLIAPELVYGWFPAQGYSFDYAKRIVSALNKYGHLYCRMFGQSFYPLGDPLPEQIVAIDEAQETGVASEPLSLEQLRGLKKKLPPEMYAWCEIAFWLGLRPQEADQIKVPSDETPAKSPAWWLEGRTVVVYQAKLRGRSPRDRYKRIHLAYREQVGALKALRRLTPKRPSRFRMRATFPPGVTVYGCRHGFTVHMDALGVPRETISRWLGHLSLATTERYYLRLGQHVRRLRKTG